MQLLNQYWPLLLVLLMFIAVVCLSRLLAGRGRMPYVKQKRLVTKTELKFYRRLRVAVADDWQIFAMVRIADLLSVEKGAANYRAWLNKILSKHIDFVLCDTNTLDVVLAIELDDLSHERPERQARDEFVDNAFEDAGLQLLRVKVQDDYAPRALRQMIDRALAN